jgi:drug/metabolite transporter (DMT)-like permease
MKNWQFFLMMILCIVVWAFAFPFIRIGLDEGLSFINLTIMRFLSVCITFGILLLFKSNIFSKLQKRDILPIFLLGFFGVMVYHFGLNYGEQLVSPGAASLIIATRPVYIIILAAIFLKERISLVKLSGIILALGGVIIISILGTEEATIEIEYLFAAFAVWIAALMGAIYTIIGKKLLVRYNALSLTIYAMLLGSIGLIPFLIISPSIISEVAALSFNGWFAIIFLGVFSTVIGYLIWYIALEIKTASELSVYLYAIPVIATIISFFWFEEQITIFFLLGGILVIAGLALVNIKNNKNKTKN